MQNNTERHEREYLAAVLDKLRAELVKTEEKIGVHKGEMTDTSGDLWEFSRTANPWAFEVNPYLHPDDPKKFSDFGDVDTLVHMTEVKRQLNIIANIAEDAIKLRRRLMRSLRSPYFGRLDFLADGGGDAKAFYIGIHPFIDKAAAKALIYDWRAPVSGMFYDFELGRAHYDAPGGTISGELTGKRQYKITDGELEYYLDTSLNISDDILQRALAGKSDERMKDIVETIQREQNAIIRDDTSKVLVIQGVAGSGKTSVALHRAAYLLYRHKDTLSSKDILIISPNNVFADYISDVLPQLGEDRLAETDMDSIAERELGNICKLQTRYEQTALAVEGGRANLAGRMRWKSRVEFIGEMDAFAAHIAETRFHARDIDADGFAIPAEFIRRRYDAYARYPFRKRLDMIFGDIKDEVLTQRHASYWKRNAELVKRSLDKMLPLPPLTELYKEFYKYIGKPEYYRRAAKNALEYSDAFPLIYLKSKVEGINAYPKVKHLIVDEMQDYSPIEYAALKLMFPCKATILGDRLQSASPCGSSGEDICAVFPGAKYMEMRKSYRSTYEIAEFAGRIVRNDDLIRVERHGAVPAIIQCADEADVTEKLLEILRVPAHSHTEGGQKADWSAGVICKTSAQAAAYHAALCAGGADAKLLHERSTKFTGGVIVTTPLMAKGLEFDRVAVVGADAENYSGDADRNLLYIACTRAMHELTLLYSGVLTELFGE